MRAVGVVRAVGTVGVVGGTRRNSEGWDNPRLTYSAIADNPEGGLAGKGVRAARAGRNFGGETRRDFETLGETRSEGGDRGLEVGKERVVHFFGGGINLLR